MNSQNLLNAIENIDDNYIEKANGNKRKIFSWKKWTTLVACFTIIVASTSIGFRYFNNHLATGSAGIGHNASSEFMSYAGPVMPLTTLDDTAGIEVARNLHYDFQNSKKVRNINGITVTDKYELMNTTAHDRKITVSYPFVGNFDSGTEEFLPQIKVNDSSVKCNLDIGGYNAEISQENFNLTNSKSWVDYKSFLSDGSYLQSTKRELANMNIPVTVFTFDDVKYPKNGDGALTLAVSFTIDTTKTTILTYGIDGSEFDQKTGFCRYSSFVCGIDENTKLIVVGNPILDYTVKGYKNGGCEKDAKEVTGAMKAKTSTLDMELHNIIAHRQDNQVSQGSIFTEERIYNVISDKIQIYILSNRTYSGAYIEGLDEMLSNAISSPRIMYFTFDVILPAGKSIYVSSSFIKSPSYDFACQGGENQGVSGFDMVTKLGSPFIFKTLTAKLTLPEEYVIVRENMGFDIEKGIYDTALDINEEHYYIEVKQKIKS